MSLKLDFVSGPGVAFGQQDQPLKALKCLKNAGAAQSVVVGRGVRSPWPPAQLFELFVTGFPLE